MWACLVEGFNTLVLAVGLNLLDKRIDPDCWLRSGFESPRRQLGFKLLSGSHQLKKLHCQATLLCASLGGGLIIYNYFFHFPRRDYLDSKLTDLMNSSLAYLKDIKIFYFNNQTIVMIKHKIHLPETNLARYDFSRFLWKLPGDTTL